MTHRSRLQSIVIDCHDIDAGVAFWCGALGVEVLEVGDPYTELHPSLPGLGLLVQRVPERKVAKSRVHLDIETDNVEREVARLEGLGATRGAQVDDWWVMCDPCGNEFCVVPVQRGGFDTEPRVWE